MEPNLTSVKTSLLLSLIYFFGYSISSGYIFWKHKLNFDFSIILTMIVAQIYFTFHVVIWIAYFIMFISH